MGRRARIAQLLDIGERRTSTRRALREIDRDLREAYQLCTEEPELPGPWRPLVAYRLGLIRLRDGHVKEADRLLLEARELPGLAPWPSLFRLPALARGDASPEALRVAFHDAEVAVRACSQQRPAPAHFDAPKLGARALCEPDGVVEFAAYFMGMDYRGPHAFVADAPYTSGRVAWLLLEVGERTPLNRALAEADFVAQQRASGAPTDVFFALPASGTAWLRARNGTPQPTHPQSLRLLAWLLLGVEDVAMLREKLGISLGDPEWDDPRDAEVARQKANAAWDQALSRTRKVLRSLLPSGDDGARGVLVRTATGGLRFPDGMKVVGLLEEAALDPELRIRRVTDGVFLGLG